MQSNRHRWRARRWHASAGGRRRWRRGTECQPLGANMLTSFLMPSLLQHLSQIGGGLQPIDSAGPAARQRVRVEALRSKQAADASHGAQKKVIADRFEAEFERELKGGNKHSLPQRRRQQAAAARCYLPAAVCPLLPLPPRLLLLPACCVLLRLVLLASAAEAR